MPHGKAIYTDACLISVLFALVRRKREIIVTFQDPVLILGTERGKPKPCDYICECVRDHPVETFVKCRRFHY